MNSHTVFFPVLKAAKFIELYKPPRVEPLSSKPYLKGQGT